MSAHEMANLLNEMLTSVSAFYSAAFATVTAFLVAAFVAAQRFNRIMVAVVIAVYTLALGVGAVMMARTIYSVVGLSHQMSKADGLEWHIAAAYPWPEGFETIGYHTTLIVVLFVYLASLIFFFQCRRVNRVDGT